MDNGDKILTILEEQREMLKDHGGSLARIEWIINGDKSSGTKGLGYRMGETEKYIERDKKLKWTIAGFAVAIKAAVIYIIYKIW